MPRAAVNLFLGAAIGAARTGRDKCIKRDKEDRKKSLSCPLDVGPLSELSLDNGRPRVFKSVAAFIYEQAAANVATRRRALATRLPPLPFSSLSLFFFIIIPEVTSRSLEAA